MSFKNLIAGAIFGTLFFIPLQAANIIIKNDGILSEKVAQKISIAGNELYEKTGILAAIVALNDLNLTLDPKDPDLKLKVANAMRGKIAEFSANLPARIENEEKNEAVKFIFSLAAILGIFGIIWAIKR